MFVGHALLAFAIAALAADWRGWERRPALTVGIVAGAFAAIPDADVAYALVGLLEWYAADGALEPTAAFWDASRGVHRSVTHSVVVGALAAPAFGLLAVRGRSARFATVAGLALLGSLVASAFVWHSPVAAFVMGLFAVAGVLVARGAARFSSLAPTTVALAALVGLLSHPWGDLVTGSPPDWLFPFAAPGLDSRVVLHPDPTLHLLAAFAIELAVVWLAVLAYCRLADRGVLDGIDRRAGVGVAYGAVALAATPPTLEVSYHFVFSILGVGLLCGVVRGPSASEFGGSLSRRLRSSRPPSSGTLEIALTALTAVTVALVAYVIVYRLAVVA